MSAAMKFGLLALVSSAAAVSHVGAHNKFHVRRSANYAANYPADVPSQESAKPYPVGGWGGYNGTTPNSASETSCTDEVPEATAAPSGTAPSGAGYPPIKPTGNGYPAQPPAGGETKVPSGDDKPTQPAGNSPPQPTGGYPTGPSDEPEGDDDEEETTTTSTITSYTTVTVWPSTTAPVEVNEVSTGAFCGIETVYVTANEKVTVTVTPSPEAPAPTMPAQPSVEFSVVSPVPVPSKEAEYPAAPPAAPPAEEQPTSAPAPPAPTSAPAPPAEEQPATTSSAAPAPSKPASNPGYTGGKRGLAYQDAKLCNEFPGAGWAYNWEAIPKGDLGKTPYIPMLRRFSVEQFYPTPEEWLNVIEDSFKAGSKAVMAFNEPDIPSQDNYSQDEVCSLMEKYTNPITSSHPDVTIIGPSVSNSNFAGQGLEWLSKFTSDCSKATWHANNIHFYDDYNEGVFERFQAHVEQAVKDGGKPVWVSEIGLNPGTASDEQASGFMEKCMSYLEGNNDVKGYAWYMVGTGNQQLTSSSALGKVYAASS